LTSVVADAIHGDVVDYGGVVNIMDGGNVYVRHGAVIKEMVVVPSSTFKPISEISKTIVDSTVEADTRSPIAFMENKPVTAPTPIAWSPEETNFGC
jgi:ADP-glucose pyrophosphorylase